MRQLIAQSALSPGKWGRPRRGSTSFEPDSNQIPWNPVKIRLKSGYYFPKNLFGLILGDNLQRLK